MAGIFEVLTPILDEGEIFDSTLMKNTFVSMLAQGKRNFSLDLSGLDYLYSDTINALLALNQQILDGNGRLTLLGPSTEVKTILEKAGITKILRIYPTEVDLQRTSDDIMRQFNVAGPIVAEPPASEPPKGKLSEFEELRAELGAAMSGHDQSGIGTSYAPPPRPTSSQPVIPPVMNRTPSPDVFQARPPMPPDIRIERVTPPRQLPKDFGPSMPPPTRTQFTPVPPSGGRQSFPPPPSNQQSLPPSDFPEKKPMLQPVTQSMPTADRWREEEEAEVLKKPSAMPIVVLVTVLVVILGVLGIFIFQNMSKSAALKSAASTPVVAPKVAQAPQITADNTAPKTDTVSNVVEKPPVVQPIKEAVVVPVKRAEPVVSAPKQVVEKKPAAARPEFVAPKRAATPPPPPPPPAPKASATPAGKSLVISSIPTGALVKVDGKMVGVTPYSFVPAMYGSLIISVSKDGYSDNTKIVDYNGSANSVTVILEKNAAAPAIPEYAKPSQSTPPPSAAAEPPSYSQQASSVPTPAPAATSSSGGDPATIFITTIPPVAEVYMDGKWIGRANITKLNVLSGTHSLRFVKGGKEFTQQMTFIPGENPSQLVRIP